MIYTRLKGTVASVLHMSSLVSTVRWYWISHVQPTGGAILCVAHVTVISIKVMMETVIRQAENAIVKKTTISLMHLRLVMIVTATWLGHMVVHVILLLASAAVVLGSLVDDVISVQMPLPRSPLWAVKLCMMDALRILRK